MKTLSIRVLVCAWLMLALLLATQATAAPFHHSTWGSYGTGDGQFRQPQGIAVDQVGSVYVCDWGNNRVQKFTGSGDFVLKWGAAGSGPGQFAGPKGIAVDDLDRVFVADSENNRIQVFTSNGAYLSSWSVTGSWPFHPSGVAIGPSGNVYVADAANQRVVVFAASGGPLRSWGVPDVMQEQLYPVYLADLVVDPAGNVYVGCEVGSYGGGSLVQVFTSEGVPVGGWSKGRWGLMMGIDSGCTIYCGSDVPHGVRAFTCDGTAVDSWTCTTGFCGPTDIAVYLDCNFYVTNSMSSTVDLWAYAPTPASRVSWGRVKALYR